MKPRHHDGVVYEASGSIYIRHWTTKPLAGQPKRVRVSHMLWRKDAKHHNTTCKPVKELARAYMATIHASTGRDVGKAPLLVTDYWTNVYLPFVTTNLKPSTVAGYLDTWERHLRGHFTGRTCQEYEPVHGNQLLNGIVADGYGRRTLAHVRSLASGVFTHAINDGVLKVNPWHDVKTKTKPPEPEETEAYTLPELMDIVNKSRCAITSPRFSLGLPISRSGAFQTLLPLYGLPSKHRLKRPGHWHDGILETTTRSRSIGHYLPVGRQTGISPADRIGHHSCVARL
jgi:hypothetical protein